MVENGDRVRVTNLEIKTNDLVREVATLGGELHTHMDQVATDKIEAKRENEVRHRDMTSRVEATLEVAQGNKGQLGILVAIAEEKEKWFGPRVSGKAKVAGVGAVGLGGIWIVIEVVGKALEMLRGLSP